MSLSMEAYFATLAKYNKRANERVYAACESLSDAERKRDRGAFFKSIHATLNHILQADRIWMSRFEGHPLQGYRLDEILHENFGDLKAARSEMDRRILTYASGLTDDVVGSHFTWMNSAGVTNGDEMSLLLGHFFNHQTHHRGQVHDMLAQAGVSTPVLDLPYVLRD